MEDTPGLSRGPAAGRPGRLRVAPSAWAQSMNRSTDRILTTHAGTLPRPPDLLELIRTRAAGQRVDDTVHDSRLREAVGDIVRKQVELGVDVVDDGEMSKPGFIHYINERLTGFEPSPDAPAGST